MVAILLALVHLQPPATGARFAQSSAEFSRLSTTDQHALLTAAFEHRIRHSKNIHYQATTKLGNYDVLDGKINKLIYASFDEAERVWRLDDVVRIDTDRSLTNLATPTHIQSNNYNENTGVSRSLIRVSGAKSPYARIDSKQDPTTHEHRYQYWFDGKHTNMGTFIFRYLLEHKDQFSVNILQNGLVTLSVPWQPQWSDKPLGIREYTLDPLKGFMPISGKGRWESRDLKGALDWRSESFTVDESRLIGDVWVPIKLRDINGASVLKTNECNVWDTTVTRIEAGTLKRDDLEVKFPVGTEVVDAIRGITYIVSEGGQETKVDRLVSAAPPAKPKTATVAARSNWLLIVVSGLTGLVLLAWLCLRVRSQRDSGSPS